MACAAQQQLSTLSTVVWRQEAQLWNCVQRSKFNPGSTRVNFWLSGMITWAHLESCCLRQLRNIVLLSVHIHKRFSAACPLTCTMPFSSQCAVVLYNNMTMFVWEEAAGGKRTAAGKQLGEFYIRAQTARQLWILQFSNQSLAVFYFCHLLLIQAPQERYNHNNKIKQRGVIGILKTSDELNWNVWWKQSWCVPARHDV